MKLVPAAVIAVLSASQAIAQGPPCPRDGLIIQTSIGTTIRGGGADPQDPSICLFRRTDGRPPNRTVYGLISANAGSLASAVRKAMHSVWPYAEGRSATVDAVQDFSSQAWQFRVDIVRRERNTVPAGTFDAWVVRITETGFAANSHLSERDYWMANGIWAPVKLEVRLKRGTTQLRSWEATSVVP